VHMAVDGAASKAERRRLLRQEKAVLRVQDRRYAARVIEGGLKDVILHDDLTPLTHAQAERLFEKLRLEAWSQPDRVTGWCGVVS